jgi:hypothetical protein
MRCRRLVMTVICRVLGEEDDVVHVEPIGREVGIGEPGLERERTKSAI